MSNVSDPTGNGTPLPQPELPEDCPPIPERALAAWYAHVEPRNLTQAVRHGLALLLAGWTYREAERESGTTRSWLADCTRRMELRPYLQRSERLVAAHRGIALRALEELEVRLQDAPDELRAKELSIVAGISTDKVRDWERWRGTDAETHSTSWERVVRQILDAGGRLDLSLTAPDGQRAEICAANNDSEDHEAT